MSEPRKCRECGTTEDLMGAANYCHPHWAKYMRKRRIPHSIVKAEAKLQLLKQRARELGIECE